MTHCCVSASSAALLYWTHGLFAITDPSYEALAAHIGCAEVVKISESWGSLTE